MANPYFSSPDEFASAGLDNPLSPTGDGLSSKKSSALTNKLANVLSSSFANPEIRDGLRLLDERGIQNGEETRRRLRADAQKEVIDSNARIVEDFGKVAEVGVCP